MASRVKIRNIRELETAVQEEIVTVDARVHRVITTEEDAISLILRNEGHYATALLHRDVVNGRIDISASRFPVESLVRVFGRVAPSVKLGSACSAISSAVTIEVQDLVVLSQAKDDLFKQAASQGTPEDLSELATLCVENINDRLDNRILDARVAETGAIFKLFSGALALGVEHLTAQHCHWIPTPKLIGYKLSGDDDYFSVPYMNGQEAWLTQTGEVHLFMALSADLDRAFDIHTVFRQEKNVSTRHLTEFVAMEVVLVVKHDWIEILNFAESLLIFIIQSLQERKQYSDLLSLANRRYPLAGKFKMALDKDGHCTRLTFREAKKILREKLGFMSDSKDDLTREEEAALGRYLAGADSGYGPPTDLFVITHYPRNIRSFDCQPSKDDPEVTNSFDIIVRGQEVSTGLHHRHSYQDLRDVMASRNPPIDPDAPMWRPYMTAHEAGMPPVGGFGIGLNRVVQGFLGLPDIHESVLFPRDACRLQP